MWNRRSSYKNQWTNRREAVILVMAVSVLATLAVHFLTGTIAVETLRAWTTIAILSMPAFVAAGHYLGTERVRGYEKGVTEKIERATHVPREPYPALEENFRQYPEAIDVTSTAR